MMCAITMDIFLQSINNKECNSDLFIKNVKDNKIIQLIIYVFTAFHL